jgi:hypothetical protein
MTPDSENEVPFGFFRKLPWISGLIVGVFWGLTYLLLGRLSGMWRMFHLNFPFFLMKVFGLHRAGVSVEWQVFFAALDGALFGAILGWLLRLLILGRKKPG